MMAGREARSGVEGQGAAPSHIPVLLDEVIEALAIAAGARIVDGTFGAGGYSRRILSAQPDARVLAIDRDPDALAQGAALVGESGGRLVLAAGRFGDLADIVATHAFGPVTGVVLDIGVSSMQLDQGERGFSFMAEGPLDMRMERAGPTAADLVNTLPEAEIADILFQLGEERQSRRIARAIVRQREARPIATTAELAALVERVLGRRHDEARHPATRTFQALRLAVNDELGELERGLAAAERVLAPGGRLVVVTFHSLEDRIVKRFLSQRAGREANVSRHAPPASEPVRPPSFRLINHRPVTPGDRELDANPRARSAKLRAAERLDCEPWPADDMAGV